jgi:hypothetical protein
MLAQLTGLTADLGPELVTLRHAVNHHHITMVCFEARYRAGKFHSDYYTRGEWLEPSELHRFPFSAPQRRIVQALTRPRQGHLF